MKAPAARMRFTRLKAKIETNVSISTPPILPTTGRIEITAKWEPKNTTKRTIEKQQKSPSLKFGGGQIDKADGGSKMKAVPELRLSDKRHTRGRKIDVSATFESDTSPAPGACVRHEDDISEYADTQAGADGDGGFTLGSDSEHQRPAKRRQNSSQQRKSSPADLNTYTFFTDSPQISSRNVMIQASSTFHAALPPDPTILTPSSTASRTDMKSQMSGRTASISTLPPPWMIAYPTPPDSLSSTGAVYGEPAVDVMPSAERDISNVGFLGNTIEATAAVVSGSDDGGETHHNHSTNPNNSQLSFESAST